MKLKPVNRAMAQAFTLIEMIGVLAVIAILASLLVPKIFNAVDQARVNNVVVSYNTMKTAVMDHYGKYGAFDKTTNGATVSSANLTNYDILLVSEGLLDKPFGSGIKIGNGSSVKVSTNAFPAYDLAAIGGNDTTNASFVVEALIQGVSAADAKDINDRLDGDKAPFSVTNGVTDAKGRVKWDSTTSVLSLYIGHR